MKKLTVIFHHWHLKISAWKSSSLKYEKCVCSYESQEQSNRFLFETFIVSCFKTGGLSRWKKFLASWKRRCLNPTHSFIFILRTTGLVLFYVYDNILLSIFNSFFRVGLELVMFLHFIVGNLFLSTENKIVEVVCRLFLLAQRGR